MEIVALQVFSADECAQLISVIDQNKHKLAITSDNGGLYLSGYEMDIESLGDKWDKFIRDRINNLIDGEIIQAFVIKYNSQLTDRMANHYDASTYSIPINLNNNFEGGGTHFPLLKYTHKPQDHSVGVGVKFTANKYKSWHGALPITNGTRYTMIVKINKGRFKFFTFIFLIVMGLILSKKEKNSLKVEIANII